jgi:superfamily II DNA/RNA helicase
MGKEHLHVQLIEQLDADNFNELRILQAIMILQVCWSRADNFIQGGRAGGRTTGLAIALRQRHLQLETQHQLSSTTWAVIFVPTMELATHMGEFLTGLCPHGRQEVNAEGKSNFWAVSTKIIGNTLDDKDPDVRTAGILVGTPSGTILRLLEERKLDFELISGPTRAQDNIGPYPDYIAILSFYMKLL